jgi:tetratricopeptide (TPR) repeat protein
MKLLQLAILILLTPLACCPFIDLQSCDALNRQANELFLKQQYDEAITSYEQAIELNPTCAELFFNLGQALYATKEYPAALEAYKKSIALKDDYCASYVQLAKIMSKFNQRDKTILLLRKAISIEPNNNSARLLLAQAYQEEAAFDKAIKILTDGIALEPNHVDLIFSLAQVYLQINRLDESLTLYRYLNEQVPNHQSIVYNIAYTLKKMGNLDEAILFYTKALEINPHFKEARFGRGLAYLSLGDFEKGLADYEYRYLPPYPPSLQQLHTTPLWDGSDLNGKIILIHNAEQSFGDTFQFIRYARLIKERNGIVIAAVQTALVPIIKLCPYIDDVVSKDEAPPYCDVHAPIMSLPYILQTRVETIPNVCPYLTADEQLVTHWKEQLSHDNNFKIGICWQGNNDPTLAGAMRAIVAQKSVHVEQFAPISAIPGVSLYSLQKTTGTGELDNLPDTMTIISFDGDFDQSNGRFMDTAAVIKNLDLVITVDTSIAHLAAGLGVNTWVILPNPADWRWMTNRTDTPWYPTMRLFRQPTPGDWTTVIEKVVEEVQQYSRERKYHD